MSERNHNHCNHLINTIRTDFNTTKKYVCCHCGEHKTEIIPHKDYSAICMFDKSEHGPFLPEYRVRLKKSDSFSNVMAAAIGEDEDE